MDKQQLPFLFKNGLVLDGFEESAFPSDYEEGRKQNAVPAS